MTITLKRSRLYDDTFSVAPVQAERGVSDLKAMSEKQKVYLIFGYTSHGIKFKFYHGKDCRGFRQPTTYKNNVDIHTDLGT